MTDLSPFGFTPTESSVYQTLLAMGPSSGYAVARAVGIARANAYQALDGLVAKGAAVLADDATPKRYRAVQPITVFATILEAEGRRLDGLERELLEQPATGADLFVRLTGQRAIRETVVRAIVRAPGEVLCVAPAAELQEMAPALRARAVAGRPIRIWSPDPPPANAPVDVRAADAELLAARFGAGVVLLLADGGLIARGDPSWDGVWSGDQLFCGLVESSIDRVTR
jgi:sugar-specific transcriptional regulator TrmB